jgi:beta-barrel assembly-enhancing protease
MKRAVIGLGMGIALTVVASAPAFADTPDQIGGLGGALKRAQQFRDLQMTDEEEQKLGAAVSEKIRERYGVVQDQAVHRYVTLVGTVLAQASSRPNLPWTFIVLDVGSVNAFAAPGGFVHITRGALGLIHSEAELAGVLGHELIHVTEKHTIRAIQKSKAVQMGAEETLSGNAGLFDRAVTATYNNIIDKGFGRAEENESDEKGIVLANKVGYAPAGLGEFLTRIKERNSSSTEKRGLFASHPEMQERLDNLTNEIKTQKLAAKATLETRYTKFITYKPTPLTEIATVEAGSAGLAGESTPAKATPGEPKKDDPKAQEKEEPKKKGLGLGRLMSPGGGEKKQAQTTGSASARGLDPEKDVKGGGNPKPVPVTVTAEQLAAFKKDITG